MLKHPFLIFFIILFTLITGTFVFIQSETFARLIQKTLISRLPTHFGVEGEFSSLSIRIFPPKVTLIKPKLKLMEKNVLGFPEGAELGAERVEFLFPIFHLFTGKVRLSEVRLLEGELKVSLLPSLFTAQKAKAGTQFKWGDLVKIKVDLFRLEKTRVTLFWPEQETETHFQAETLQLAGMSHPQTHEMSYHLEFRLRNLEAGYGELPAIDQIRGKILVSANRVQVDALELKNEGALLNFKGGMTGDVLKPQKLRLSSDMEFVGRFEKIKDFLRLKNQVSGDLVFNGKVSCSLDRVLDTLEVQGSVEGKNIAWDAWKIDTVRIDGSVTPEVLSIQKVRMESAVIPRREGVPASGGKIEMGAFQMNLKSHETDEIPLHLENAHLHWLLPQIGVSVFQLQFRLNGDIKLKLQPAVGPSGKSSWNLAAQTALEVREFCLDNQRADETKVLTKILDIEKILVSGGVTANSDLISFQDLDIRIANTRLKMHGTIDPAKGLDLSGSGDADLSEIRHIAEIPISGIGKTQVHVHGPFSRVLFDFDADLEKAKYVHLDFGGFRGRVTYDENPGMLLLSGIEVRRNQTLVRGGGNIDVAYTEKIDIQFDVPNGTVQDFNQIFAEQAALISWYPQTMTGTLQGKGRVSGMTRMSAMRIEAELKGKEWEYWGEKMRTVEMSGGYDRGRYYISGLNGYKRNGFLEGEISYDPDDGELEWELDSANLLITDFEHIARLDVPLRGNLILKSKGSGKMGSLESRTHLGLKNMAVRGQGFAPSELLITSSKGVIELQASALGDQGVLNWKYDYNPGGQGHFLAVAENLDFSPLLLLLNSKLMQDPALVGRISGRMEVGFRDGHEEDASGRFEFNEFQLSKTGTQFNLGLPVQLEMKNGTFDLKNLWLEGPQGKAKAELSGRQGILSGKIDGKLDIALAEFVTPAIARTKGVADLDFDIAGYFKNPILEGQASFESAMLKLAALESPFENITGTVRLHDNDIQVQKVEADLAKGRAFVSGPIEIFWDRVPSLKLQGGLRGCKLKIFPFQFIQLTGNLSLTGNSLPYLAEGSLTSESALSKESFMRKSTVRGLKAVRFAPAAESGSDVGYALIRLKINTHADRNVLIQNELMDAEGKGEISLVNTLENPQIVGHAEVVQGKIFFKDRVFLIQSGSATFDSPAVFNPRINLTAVTEISNMKIQLYAIGKMDQYRVDLTSNPVRNESEILSILALGVSPEDIKKMNVDDSSAIEKGGAASLLLHSLDLNRDVKDKTGFQVQLDETISNPTGSSVFRPRSTSDTAAAPKLVIRRNLGRNFELSAGGTVGMGSAYQREVNAEYRFTPAFSVIGVWDSQEDLNAQNNRTSFGLDLKLQKRFK